MKRLAPVIALAFLVGCGSGGGADREFTVPSESMVPTLHTGDKVKVDADPKSVGRGDIVIFHPPQGADDDVCGVNHSEFSPCPRPTPERSNVIFIKRIVATPGDQISIRSGRVLLKKPGGSEFSQQKEPFIQPSSDCDICNLTQPVSVPSGHVFVVGDNRGASDDSRKWGPIRSAWITGKVLDVKKERGPKIE